MNSKLDIESRLKTNKLNREKAIDYLGDLIKQSALTLADIIFSDKELMEQIPIDLEFDYHSNQTDWLFTNGESVCGKARGEKLDRPSYTAIRRCYLQADNPNSDAHIRISKELLKEKVEKQPAPKKGLRGLLENVRSPKPVTAYTWEEYMDVAFRILRHGYTHTYLHVRKFEDGKRDVMISRGENSMSFNDFLETRKKK